MLKLLSLMVITGSLYMEENACVIIAIPIIERPFDNDYTHILHDLLKQYI